MMSLESSKTVFKPRAKSKLSSEFNYSILQALIFELLMNLIVTIQFGGSDQWGNIVSELI